MTKDFIRSQILNYWIGKWKSFVLNWNSWKLWTNSVQRHVLLLLLYFANVKWMQVQRVIFVMYVSLLQVYLFVKFWKWWYWCKFNSTVNRTRTCAILDEYSRITKAIAVLLDKIESFIPFSNVFRRRSFGLFFRQKKTLRFAIQALMSIKYLKHYRSPARQFNSIFHSTLKRLSVTVFRSFLFAKKKKLRFASQMLNVCTIFNTPVFNLVKPRI